MIKMKGQLFRIYKNNEGKKAFVYQHANKTVRWILEDSNIPSKSCMPDHANKLLGNQGFKLDEEFEVIYLKRRDRPGSKKKKKEKKVKDNGESKGL